MKNIENTHAAQHTFASQHPQVPRALLYDLEEMCELCHISRSYLFALIKNREISIVKLGRRTLVPAEEVNRLIANHLKPAL